MFGPAKVGRHFARGSDFSKAKWLVKRHEFIDACEPQGTAVHLLQRLNDSPSNALPAPGFNHSNGSQFARAVPVGFDLTAADDTAVPIHCHQKPLPFQAERIDAHFFDECFNSGLVGFGSRA